MTQIPEPQIEPSPIAEMAMGHQMSQILSTAMDYDIFTLCELPKSLEQVCEELGTDPEMTRRLLNTLVALQLLQKEGDKYVNAPVADAFLVKGKSFYQGNLIKLYASYPVWPKLGQALKEGVKEVWRPETLLEMGQTFDPTFTLAMAEYGMRGGVQAVVRLVSELPEFKRAKKLLDLGGGTGIYAIALAQAKPDLEVIVFDIPPVLELTKEFIGRYKMEHRFGLMGGDYEKDDFGAGYDIVFASHTFYQPKEMLSPLLEKIYNALNEGGIIISNHWTLNNDGTGHPIVVLWDLWLWLIPYEHHTYTNDEYAELLKRAGFSMTHIVDISNPSYAAAIFIGKKEV